MREETGEFLCKARENERKHVGNCRLRRFFRDLVTSSEKIYIDLDTLNVGNSRESPLFFPAHFLCKAIRNFSKQQDGKSAGCWMYLTVDFFLATP